MLHQVIHEDPVQPTQINEFVPRELETIALKAMAKERTERFQTAQEFGAELRRWLEGDPILSSPPSHLMRIVKWCRKRPLIAGLSGLAVSLLIAITALSILWANSAIENQRTTRRTLARTLLRNAATESGKSGPGAGLPYAVEALRVHQALGDEPAERMGRLQAGRILSTMPRLIHVANFRARIDHAEFDHSSNRQLFVSAGRELSWFPVEDPAAKRTVQMGNRAKRLSIAASGHRVVSIPHPTANRGLADTESQSTSIAQLWNTQNATLITELKHNAAIMNAAINETVVATCGNDGCVRIWSLDDGREIETLEQPGEFVSRVWFSTDSKYMACFSTKRTNEPSVLRVYDLETQNYFDVEEYSFVRDCLFTDTTILAGCGKRLREWKLTDGQPTEFECAHASAIYRVSALPTGQILTHCADQVTTVWNRDSGTVAYQPARLGESTNQPFATNGRIYCSPGSNFRMNLTWASTGRPVCPPISDSTETLALTVDPGARFVGQGNSEGVLRVWDLAGISRGSRILKTASVAVAPAYASNSQTMTFRADRVQEVLNAKSTTPIQLESGHDEPVVTALYLSIIHI